MLTIPLVTKVRGGIDDKAFVDALYHEGVSRGLQIEYPAVPAKKSNPRDLEKDFVDLYKKLAETQKPDMILVIVPVKDSQVSMFFYYQRCLIKFKCSYLTEGDGSVLLTPS